MAYKLVNLAKFERPFMEDREQILTLAKLLDLQISFMDAGSGFINVSGDEQCIENFVSAIQHPATDYDPDQTGDTSDDI